jgi:type IV secretion system protein VirB10
MTPGVGGSDPRVGALAEPPTSFDDLEPVVGRPPGRNNGVLIVSGFVLAAILLFLALNSRRAHVQPSSLVSPAGEVAAVSAPIPAEPPPLKLASSPVAPAAPPSPPPPAPEVAQMPPSGPPPVAASSTALDALQRTPTMVVDLGAASGEPVKAATGPATGTGQAPAQTGAETPAVAAGAGAQGGADDQFAARLGDERPARSRAVTMTNLGALVPQGTIIPATLETAIDSDVPGYTRAVVSRDVLSFDGKKVLIPRGSRLIGQYKSGVALGSTRAFVIWTRIIRADGVSIQIGSPGADPLGRAGLPGQVDTHFFARFGGSILLSVLNAGVAAVSQHPSTNISIGTSGAAVGAANSVQGDAIPPTIKVAQGVSVNIFVARDLDFSDVADVK